MKILHLEYNQYPAESIKRMEQFFTVEVFNCADQLSLYEKLSSGSYTAIFTRLGIMMDSRAIELQPSLKYIVTPTTGLNHIDTDSARNRNVHIVSLKGEYDFLSQIKSTAEHTWGLLLALIRHLPAAHDQVLEGKWDRNPFLSDELNGATLGIVGYGRLGKIVARYGEVFGMNVLVHDVDKNAYKGHTHVHAMELTDLLKQSDYVVLLVSWSKENENLMNEHRFKKMKKGSYFINTSRGELVDEKALLHVLKSGDLKGAALDVLWNDSSWPGILEGSSELIDYASMNSNLLITPHMGGYGRYSIATTRRFVTDKFLSLTQNSTTNA